MGRGGVGGQGPADGWLPHGARGKPRMTQHTVNNSNIFYEHLKLFVLHFCLPLPLKSPAKFTVLSVNWEGICKK